MGMTQFAEDLRLPFTASDAPREIAQIAAFGEVFRKALDDAKARVSSRDFEWYPYDSLSNLQNLERLLTGQGRFLLELAGDAPLLDIGCADGDLSFLFEALGCVVEAIDNPVTNFNSMRGLRALRDVLSSNVIIHSMDIDDQFCLKGDRYGLVLLLGILYHLKNPYLFTV